MSHEDLLESWAVPLAAAPALQKVAQQIAVRSLRRWDGFLGFRAGHDGLGRTLGVWKDKFDGVRFAVLLLAMRKLNEQLRLRHGASGGQPVLMMFAGCTFKLLAESRFTYLCA